MFIPLGTDRPRRRRPRATGVIIVLNMLVYLVGLILDVTGTSELETFMSSLALSKSGLENGSVWQLLTYQFAHSPNDIFHMAGNMLFLWIFGSALEDRLGHVNFVVFYLLGGIVAGVAHTLVAVNPVIGASGAVCAATGGFIVLFPRARVKILFIFILIGIFMIPALWVVALFVFFDLSGIFKATGSVAHTAHLAGYAYGFLLALLLVATRIVKSDEYDLIYLIRQRHRRSAYRRVVREAESATRVSSDSDTVIPVLAPAVENPEEAAARNRVMQLFRANQHEEAQQAFRELQKSHPDAVLPESMQLDIANRLQATGDRRTAASAYDRFLDRYPTSRQAPEVRLLLASLMVRFLNRPDDARMLLEKAMPDLQSDGHRALAQRLLEECCSGQEPTT
ncbi:MAG: rhomboid family intramembrane serine protease [Phycisphaerales bacterium]|nr:rhomboid family intramembrane serine protease [Phycisphaerales bacterium]